MQTINRGAARLSEDVYSGGKIHKPIQKPAEAVGSGADRHNDVLYRFRIWPRGENYQQSIRHTSIGRVQRAGTADTVELLELAQEVARSMVRGLPGLHSHERS